MLEKLFTSHISDLQNALGRATQRQSLLMTNLANVNVPGYKRQDIDFHVALEDQMGARAQYLRDQQDRQTQAASDGSSLRLDGNNVDMEREVMGIAETEMRFQALSQLTADYFGGLKNVIREGK